MEPILLTVYMLVWPVLVAGTLFVIVRGFIADVRQARAEQRDII